MAISGCGSSTWRTNDKRIAMNAEWTDRKLRSRRPRPLASMEAAVRARRAARSRPRLSGTKIRRQLWLASQT